MEFGMEVDGRSVLQDQELEFDVCVVGAGAAGITLALELDEGAARIALIESGGFEPDPATQRLNQGEVGKGLPHGPLDEYRSRIFGGTTSLWGGGCIPLDAIDFESRPYVERSGWPIRRADLDPFYQRAAVYTEIQTANMDPEVLEDPMHPEVIESIGATGTFATRYSRKGPPTRFGERYRSSVRSSSNVTLFSWSTVTRLRFERVPHRLDRVEVRTLDGNRFFIRAQIFVLAMGGLEIPRLLLSSTDHQHPRGVGNERDLVGRFYSPHLNAADGIILLKEGVTVHPLSYEKTVDGADIHRFLTLTEEAQREHRLLNFRMTFHSFADVSAHPLTHQVATVINQRAYRPGGLRGRVFDMLNRWAVPRGAGSAHSFIAMFEQVPNPESRIVLTDKRDALGLPRIRLHHRMLPQDLESALKTYAMLAQTLGELGLGRFCYDLSGESLRRGCIGKSHHIGMTRMAEGPTEGVVDRDCRLFEVENLFVASASVFPTSAPASPTFTIIALAIRLADLLKERSVV